MVAVGAALIGVFGALVGVILTERQQRRREDAAAEARLRAAARMVSAELGMAANALESAHGTGGWWTLAALPTAGWGEHGAALATVLSDEQFYAVATATSKVVAIKATGELLGLEPGTAPKIQRADTDVPFDDLVAECRAAQAVLRRFAYPEDWAAHPDP